jgi:putative oxidoreductase
MRQLATLHNRVFGRLESLDGWILPTLARLVFAATLLRYFWASAATKLGDGPLGLFNPGVGAYFQIFPKKTDAVYGDVSQLGWFEYAVVLGGTVAEYLLPLLLVVGLLTRLSALGMIGFVLVQSLTDIYGHNVDAATIGSWFDRGSGALILDQRAFWVFLLIVLAVKGAGPLSLDAVIGRRAARDPAYA